MVRFTKAWWAQVADRALRTAAQSAIGAMAGCAAIHEVNAGMVLSTVALATLMSLLMSLAGLPDPEQKKETPDEIEG